MGVAGSHSLSQLASQTDLHFIPDGPGLHTRPALHTRRTCTSYQTHLHFIPDAPALHTRRTCTSYQTHLHFKPDLHFIPDAPVLHTRSPLLFGGCGHGRYPPPRGHRAQCWSPNRTCWMEHLHSSSALNYTLGDSCNN